MNYERIYTQLIDRARTRTLLGYKERHHIIPRCIGGNNDALNLVDLTAREHFIAHKLLCEIYPNIKGIQLAFWAMVVYKSKKNQRTYKISAREYESLRLDVIEIIRDTQLNREKWTHTPKTKQKIKAALMGKKKSKEHTTKIWESRNRNGNNIPWNKGVIGIIKDSDETKEKKRLAHLGKKRKPHSEETKQKIRESLKQTRLDKKIKIKFGFNR